VLEELGHVEEGEGVMTPELFASGKPIAEGVGAFAAAILEEKALVDGPLEPTFECHAVGRVAAGPVFGDLGAVPLAGGDGEERPEELPAASELVVAEGAVAEVIGAVGGPFDYELTRRLGEA
jgi:hypothetical protein